MGVTLSAYVERRDPGSEHWHRLARWSLGKDYELMRALHTQATRDWPLDVSFRNLPEYDFHRYWLEANTVVTGLVTPNPEWDSLQASLLPLVKAPGETRVLFIEI